MHLYLKENEYKVILIPTKQWTVNNEVMKLTYPFEIEGLEKFLTEKTENIIHTYRYTIPMKCIYAIYGQ